MEPIQYEITARRLASDKEEINRLEQSATRIKKEISDKRRICEELQENAEEAKRKAETLEEEMTILQERRQKLDNRANMVKGTIYATQDREVLNKIEVEIESSKTAYLEALGKRDNAKKALQQVATLKKEIASLNDELRKQQQSRDELNEQTKELEGMLETIELLNKQEKSSPESHVFSAWLAFMDALRERGKKCMPLVMVNENQYVPIADLLSIYPQDIAHYSNVANWRNRPVIDSQGRETRKTTTHRTELVERAMQNYE